MTCSCCAEKAVTTCWGCTMPVCDRYRVIAGKKLCAMCSWMVEQGWCTLDHLSRFREINKTVKLDSPVESAV